MTTPDFAATTAKRIEGLLMPDEEVRYAARRHWLSYQRALFCLLIAVLALLASLLTRQPDGPIFISLSGIETQNLGGGGIQRLMCEYVAAFMLVLSVLSATTTAVLNWTLIMAVTSRRIILRMGLVARDTTDLPLSKIDIVMIDQGVVDRLTGGGTVIVRTVSEATTSFAAINNPTAFRNAIIGAIEDAGNQANKSV